jgi:hypothetical protein
LVVHVVHAPVDSNESDPAVAPLTTRLAGLAPVVAPWANRIPSVAVRAVAEFTVNSAKAPLSPLQNPLPEQPA